MIYDPLRKYLIQMNICYNFLIAFGQVWRRKNSNCFSVQPVLFGLKGNKWRGVGGGQNHKLAKTFCCSQIKGGLAKKKSQNVQLQDA